MIHQNSRAVSWLSVFSVGVAAICMLGCAADDTPNGETNEVSKATQALSGGFPIVIAYFDDRTATSFQVRIEAVDQWNGGLYAGVASVPVPMNDGHVNQAWDYMTWTQDGLSQDGHGLHVGGIQINDLSAAPHQFGNTTMRVTATATIVGACHTDWEDITPGGSYVSLQFDGRGAPRFDGQCYVGDLLHHY